MSNLINQSSLFCSCTPSVASVTQSTPCDDCVTAVSAITDCDTSTPPGGASGSLDLAALNNYGGCDDGSPCTLTYTVLSYDEVALTNVGIDADGLLTWDTTADAVPDSLVEVNYIVQCDCNTLSARACIRICIRDLCEGKYCPSGEQCNQTTGLCDPIDPDIELS